VPDCKPPYSWAADNASTPEGLALYKLKEPELKKDFLKIIDGRMTNNAPLLTTQKGKCDAIRTAMSKDVVDLKYEKALVFGPQDAWVSVGMSEYFDKVPLPFKTGSTERIQLHKNLEQKHINLFNCDIDELKYSKIEKILKELKDDKMLAAYLKSIAFQIKSMEKDKANDFIKQHNEGKMNDFIFWLAELLDKKIDYDLKYKKYTTDASNFENYPSSLLKNDWDKIPVGIGQVEPETKKGKYQISLENIGQMAANDEAVMQLLKVYHEHPEKLTQTVEANLQFEYEQGYEKIGGISRAFVLEAVNKKRVISELLGGSSVDVQGTPLTKKKDGSAKIINTYYDNFKFTPQGATMDIFVIVNFRDYQQVFQVINAPLSLSGFKEPIKLALGSDISFPLGKMARMTLKSQPAQVANNGKPTTAITNSNAPQAANSGDDGTYVVIDCDGFGGLNIDAKIEFCRNYLIPIDAKDIELAEPARVESSFKVKIKDFDDFVIEKLSFSPFTLEKHRDIKIRIKDIVLDFSDTYTPSIVKFPGNYITAFSNSANNSQAPPAPTKEWKGFYVGNIDVTLPKEWSSGSNPIVVIAKDFIIDDAGVSGILGVKDVLPAGNMSGWKFSITDLNITILHNKLVGAGFSGRIHLPILKDGQDLIYSAAILPGNGYQFAVKPPKDGLDVDVWVAKVKFYDNSFIDVRYINKKFTATASLSGDIDVKGGSVITMDGFTFKELVLSTDKAVVSPGTWTIPTLGCHVRGFGLTISNIKLTKEEKSGRTYTKLNVDVGLSLGKDDEKGLSLAANGNFDILGEVRIVDKEQKWSYKSVKINGFGINCSSNKFHLEGSLTFYEDDPTYGEGFYGGLKLNIEKAQISIGAAAVFGKKMKSSDPNDYYRYFFVDAFVKLPKGVPLGPVDLNGFGGGVSWRMQKADFNNLKLENAPIEVGNEPTKPSMKGPVSLTGAVYVPDETIGLGIKLMTTMELNSNPNAFNAAAALELVFDADGTLNHIGFDGVAHFMAPPPAFPVFTLDTKSIPNGIHAGLKMYYDFNNNIFTAKMDAYANIEDGIIGCGSGGTNPCAEKKLGAIDMYFNAPQKQWYIKIGRTDDKGENRIGAGVSVKYFGQIIATAYFNIGNYSIHPMPPLPSYAADLVGGINKNETTRSNGKGFAFGATLGLKTEIDAFIYASLSVDIGFDMMLMQYPNVVCTNYNSKPIGINGWYAEGQLYARLMGKMGIKIKNKKISIGELTVAAAMAAGGPNPFWATGGASIKYNVLGGFIQGSAKTTFKIGEKCEKYNPDGGSTEPDPNIQVIDKVTPETGINDISVFTKPKVDLFLPVGKVIEYEPGSYLKSNVSKLKFTYDNGIDMNVTLIYNEDKSSFIVKPIKGMFPSGKKCKLEVVATAYDCSSSGTILSTISDDVRKIEFTTEKLINIPAENIAASYPYSGMHNYHKEENNTGEGFVTLYTDQQDLFSENDDKTPLVRFYHKNKLVASVPFTYSKNKINFKMPNSKLMADKVYFMSFVLEGYGDGESNNGLAASQTTDKTIFSQFFRVSKYNTFLEKTKNVALNSTYDNVKLTAIDEPFDEQELSKDAQLLDISFSEPSDWTNKMKTLYQQYNGQSFTFFVEEGKTYYLNLVFNSNTGFFEKTSNTNTAKKVDKTSYDIGEISYSNQTFNYQFDFKVYQQNVNSAISGQVSSEESNYSSEFCVLSYFGDCVNKDNCVKACKNSVTNAAKAFITKLGNIQQPPKPTTTTFNFSYRIPTEAVNSSQVAKVCNH
jgi:hypothetical protein